MDWLKPNLGPHSEDLNAKRLAFHAGPCWLKLLVADRVAGSIIGKGGKVITDIETSSGCIMKLSPGQTFFPGTQERIVVVSGTLEGISEAVRVILMKVRMFVVSEFRQQSSMPGMVVDHLMEQQFLMETSSGTISSSSLQQSTGSMGLGGATSSASPSVLPIDVNVDITVRAVVPNSAVSSIIGRGGEVVKEINRATGAMIRIGDRMTIVHERIVQVAGTVDQVHLALIEILTRIQSDKNLKEHLNVVYTKAAMQSNRPSPIASSSPSYQQPPIATLPSSVSSSPSDSMGLSAAGVMAGNIMGLASSPGPMPSGAFQSLSPNLSSMSAAPQVQTPSGPVNMFELATTIGAPPTAVAGTLQPTPSGVSSLYSQTCSISLTLPPGTVSTSVFRRVEQHTGTQIRFRQSTGTVQISGPFASVHNAHMLLLKETSVAGGRQESAASSSSPGSGHNGAGGESSGVDVSTMSPPTTNTPSPTSQMKMLQ